MRDGNYSVGLSLSSLCTLHADEEKLRDGSKELNSFCAARVFVSDRRSHFISAHAKHL
jgi:hypothetical protein